MIPKGHIGGHKEDCQTAFSLNLILGSARSDGEGIERPWAHLGPVAMSTCEMGPRSRQDTLEDHLGHWNWQKLVGLGHLLMKRLRNAVREHRVQTVALEEFSAAQIASVDGWRQWILDWEANRRSDNPYVLPHSGVSEKEVHLQLLEEEALAEKEGTLPLHDISPVEFVMAGLELEERQYVFVSMSACFAY